MTESPRSEVNKLFNMVPLLIVPRRYFCGGPFVLCLGVFKMLCCWHLKYVFIFLVKFR